MNTSLSWASLVFWHISIASQVFLEQAAALGASEEPVRWSTQLETGQSACD